MQHIPPKINLVPAILISIFNFSLLVNEAAGNTENAVNGNIIAGARIVKPISSTFGKPKLAPFFTWKDHFIEYLVFC